MGSIRMPNFPAFCCPHFELRCSPHCHPTLVASEKWALSTPLFLDPDEEAALPGLRFGLLAALCFPTADPGPLLAVAKFLIVLHHWTDRPRALYQDEEVFDPIWTKSFRPSTRRDWHKRFQRHLAAFRLGQAVMARDEAEHTVPDFESYVLTRRDASGARLLLDLVVYAGGLTLPPQVYDHPLLRRLRQDAADAIAWATDIAAYARHPHACGLVTVLMAERRFAPQGAVHFAGNLVKDTLANFVHNEALLLGARGAGAGGGFGDWDAEVRAYVRGLRDCVVGTLHWMYETERFFGDAGEDVRSSGWAFVGS